MFIVILSLSKSLTNYKSLKGELCSGGPTLINLIQINFIMIHLWLIEVVALLMIYQVEYVSSMFWSYPGQKSAYTLFTNKNTNFIKYQH